MKRKTICHRAFICCFALTLALPQVLFGQTTTATILGTVRDQGGAVVGGATVTAKSLETGLERSVKTDEEGRYRIGQLSPGRYEARAEQQGFNVEVRDAITLTVGSEVAVDFNLAVGNISDKVVVTGDAAQIETTSPTLSGLVNNRTIQELPLNGRDVFQLTTLQTGVVSAVGIVGGNVLGGGATLIGPGNTKISVNGQRVTANSFLLDGTVINDAFNNTPGGLSGSFLGVDAFQEFQVLTNSYGAEYGQAGGAVINAVTKSGTNDLHGSAFEFHRNDNFDARNFFDPGEKPEFKRNQFGGSLGGPIVKNQTFIFGSYEGFRQNLGVSRRFAVPTAAARARAVPAVRPYIDLYPQPNGETLNADTAFYIRAANDTIEEDSFVVRVDHQFSPKHSLAGRYSFDDSALDVAGHVIQNVNTVARNQYFTLSWTQVASQRFVNVARLGFNRSHILGTEPILVDIPESLSFIPGHPVGGFFGLADVAPIINSLQVPRDFTFNSYEFNDQANYTRGSHALKFGGLARRMQFNSLQGRAFDGVYVFSGLASLLAARPVAFVAPTPDSSFYRGIRESLFALYLQDDWKVRPNLTFNLGLRYEFFTVPTEANGLIANLRNPTDIETTIGEPFIKNPSKKNFAPRLGFAWQPFADNKTSVRGGFGIFDVVLLPYNYRSEMTLQPPFAKTATLVLPPFPNAYDVILTNAAPVPLELNAMTFEFERSYVMQYNLSVQREIGFNTVVSAAYVGSRGVHLVRRNNVNTRIDFEILPDGRKFYPQIPRNQVQSKLLNPRFGAVRYVIPDADSIYHGLQLSANKRLSNNFEFTLAYTFAKAIDTAADYTGSFANTGPGGAAQDTFNLRNERGLSNLHVRHAFSSSWVYALPFGGGLDGFAGKLASGWQLNGFITARSGFFFNPLLGFDRAQDGTATSGLAQRPDLAPGRNSENIVLGRPERYFDPTAFVLPEAGTYGNVGRNILEGPGLVTVDMGITKNTTLTERLRMQIRVEAFNLLNRANFALPDNLVVITDAAGSIPGNAGVITSTATTSRQIQLGVKFTF
ncbi:MAG TPA: TonB-dependent receptor [Blastocatellia bacterium]|nr:TonB-dependent receptor [Blastocatellia bacterium]